MMQATIESCEHGNIPLICKECHPSYAPAKDRVKELEDLLKACYMHRHVSEIHSLHNRDGVRRCWLEGQKIMDRIKGINK